jgi:hypothetical protein
MRFGERLIGGEAVSEWLKPTLNNVNSVGSASDVISGGFRTITFNSSGELVVNNKPITVEYLVVGGGGGGGAAESNFVSIISGGGGGGGGVLSGSSLILPVGKHKITVGAGGAGGVVGTSVALNGNPSYLSGYIAAFGGARGNGRSSDFSVYPILSGSSQGGAQAGAASTGSVILMPTSQGNIGGNGIETLNSGGGGGAGGVGGTATTSTGGTGGIGISNSITGTSVGYGGGGGGAGNTTAGTGSDGGGNGATSSVAATSGAANRGGGGGGGRLNQQNGGSGGSGVVIIRYSI